MRFCTTCCIHAWEFMRMQASATRYACMYISWNGHDLIRYMCRFTYTCLDASVYICLFVCVRLYTLGTYACRIHIVILVHACVRMHFHTHIHTRIHDHFPYANSKHLNNVTISIKHTYTQTQTHSYHYTHWHSAEHISHTHVHSSANPRHLQAPSPFRDHQGAENLEETAHTHQRRHRAHNRGSRNGGMGYGRRGSSEQELRSMLQEGHWTLVRAAAHRIYKRIALIRVRECVLIVWEYMGVCMRVCMCVFRWFQFKWKLCRYEACTYARVYVSTPVQYIDAHAFECVYTHAWCRRRTECCNLKFRHFRAHQLRRTAAQGTMSLPRSEGSRIMCSRSCRLTRRIRACKSCKSFALILLVCRASWGCAV